MTKTDDKSAPGKKTNLWIGPVIFMVLVAVIALVGLLGYSIYESRFETKLMVVYNPIDGPDPDNAVWGRNFPRQYDSYLRMAGSTTRTEYGGAFPRDYLDESPNLVILFAGYGFSDDYLQARGHSHAVEDVTDTERIKDGFMAGTCWTCKSPDVPRMMKEMGTAEFYAANFHDLKKEITNPIGCADCHDPETMELIITRPALREGYKKLTGKDIDQASHQEKRSLVCAQCHVEYYFAKDPKNYLTFPWEQGTDVEGMLKYYDSLPNFSDWVHPISGTPIVKAQHPDWEVFTQGIHAYKGVACADCHMPFREEGGIKFTDHHVQSPLLNINTSCARCHNHWSESEIVARVESIQDQVFKARQAAERAIVLAHFDVAAAIEAKVSDADLEAVRKAIRHAQFRWDYVAANNGMGFHSPQGCTRILGEAAAGAQEARLAVARLLAAKNISATPKYPDISTRKLALEAIAKIKDGKLKLLP